MAYYILQSEGKREEYATLRLIGPFDTNGAAADYGAYYCHHDPNWHVVKLPGAGSQYRMTVDKPKFKLAPKGTYGNSKAKESSVVDTGIQQHGV